MVGAAEALGSAASEAELRRIYATALAETAEDAPDEIAALRRAFLERQIHLLGAPVPTRAPRADGPTSESHSATELPYRKTSRWKRPSFWITLCFLVVLWTLFKRLVLRG